MCRVRDSIRPSVYSATAVAPYPGVYETVTPCLVAAATSMQLPYPMPKKQMNLSLGQAAMTSASMTE